MLPSFVDTYKCGQLWDQTKAYEKEIAWRPPVLSFKEHSTYNVEQLSLGNQKPVFRRILYLCYQFRTISPIINEFKPNYWIMNALIAQKKGTGFSWIALWKRFCNSAFDKPDTSAHPVYAFNYRSDAYPPERVDSEGATLVGFIASSSLTTHGLTIWLRTALNMCDYRLHCAHLIPGKLSVEGKESNKRTTNTSSPIPCHLHSCLGQ